MTNNIKQKSTKTGCFSKTFPTFAVATTTINYKHHDINLGCPRVFCYRKEHKQLRASNCNFKNIMRKSIDTYINAIAHDNEQYIKDGGYSSMADYIISNAESTGWQEFFDDSELNETGEPTDEQIDELKAYLNENYNYLPERNLEDIAYENGLELIETTSGWNGYPQGLQKAIIGFDSFEQADELAKKNGLSIECFTKRDGWNLWYRTGNKEWEPFERSADEYGDNASEFSNEDLEEFYENEVQPFVSDFNDFASLRSFLDNKEKIYDEI